MTDHNLEKELHLNEVDPDELNQILLHHYTTSSTKDDLLYFGSDQANPRLVIRHSSDDRISVEKIENTDIPILEKLVRENLIESQVEGFAQTIIFSHQPLRDFFTYKDALQLIPTPEHAPQPPYGIGEYSCLLQFKYISSPNQMINWKRILQRGQELVDIMNVLTRGTFKPLSNAAYSTWVIDDVTAEASVKYAFKQVGYGYDGFNGIIPRLSTINDLNPINLVDEEAYYKSSGYIIVGAELELPASFPRDLQVAFDLNQERAKRFKTACLWTRKAIETWRISRSLTFVAAVTAIEALIIKKSDNRKCSTCDRYLNPASGQRFKDFMKKYAASDKETSDLVNEIYTTRSLLSHGDVILRSDADAAFISHKKTKEDARMRALNYLMYFVLRGWLLEDLGKENVGKIPI